jgi:hypothetical protein
MFLTIGLKLKYVIVDFMTKSIDIDLLIIRSLLISALNNPLLLQLCRGSS